MESGSIQGVGPTGGSVLPMTLRLSRAYGGDGGGAGGGAGVGGARSAQTRTVGDSMLSSSLPMSSLTTSLPSGASSGLSGLRSLVAGVVPGRVDFSGDVPAHGSVSRPFYRHPADRNAAAVQIDIGKRIDVNG